MKINCVIARIVSAPLLLWQPPAQMVRKITAAFDLESVSTKTSQSPTQMNAETAYDMHN